MTDRIEELKKKIAELAQEQETIYQEYKEQYTDEFREYDRGFIEGLKRTLSEIAKYQAGYIT